MDRGREFILKATMILFLLSSVVVGVIAYMVYVSINGSYFDKMKAGEIVRRYMYAKYPGLELEIDRVDYNAKRDTYSVAVYSKISQDTYFDIYLDQNDKVESDSYELVENGTTTFWRLSFGYGDIVKEAFERKFRKDLAFCSAELRSDYLEKDLNHSIIKKGLERDKDYDVLQLGKRAGLIDVCFNIPYVSNIQLAKIFKECKEFLDEERIPFHMMAIIIQDSNGGSNAKTYSATLRYEEINNNILNKINSSNKRMQKHESR